MENTLTPEKFWDKLVAMFAHLNDNNAKAKEIYDAAMAQYQANKKK